MRVRAGAGQQPVLALEPERLVVVGVEHQPRVVHLEHVDLGQVAKQRRRRRDRVHPVERVRDVDDPVLLADRGDRVRERHPARDLLVEEEPDHLALVVGLDLLAGNHDQLAAAGELDRLERAAEDVVVGDGDGSEPFGLGVLDQRLRLDRAVVRPVRVHVEVDDDPVAVGERVASRGGAERAGAGAST